MRIIEASTLAPEDRIAMIGFVGSPSVSNERLISGDEFSLASEELFNFLRLPPVSAMISGEIGGANGMRPFAAAAAMDIPVIDGDPMGRAFPKVDLVLPYVHEKATPAPAALSDARGNVQIISRVEDSHRFESIVRSASVEFGLSAAMSLAPLSKEVTEEFCCLGTLSFAWSLGREIMLARKRKTDIAQALV
jgi:DUF917 family protein